MKKNQVTKAKFLDWYFDDHEMVLELQRRWADMLIEKGVITLTPEDLFKDCGYIPANICIGQEGNDSEYDTSEVTLVDFKEGQTFARKCSATNLGMNRGWVTHDFEYFLFEDDAHNWCKDNEFEDIEDAFLQDAIYYTEWGSDDDEYQFTNGQFVEL